MTISLRARKGLAITASVATAVAALTGCAGSHGSTPPHSPAIANTPVSKSISVPAPTTTTSSARPVPSVTKLNPVVPQAKPPAADLGLGQTGTRDQIPWNSVTTGWRLLQPGGWPAPKNSLYLYDPEGGRYLISDQLPSKEMLQAWSPDLHRALLSGDNIQQVDLHSGLVVSGFPRGNRGFASYTRPTGAAILLQDYTSFHLERVDADGRVQQNYPHSVAGVGSLDGQALYTYDGAAFVTGSSDHTMLMGNNGNPIRSFTKPAEATRACTPGIWWTSTEFTENCQKDDYSFATYLQSVNGGEPTPFISTDSPTSLGYTTLQRLSNGDGLLEVNRGCGSSAGYGIRNPDGSVHPLRLPAGVPGLGNIVGVSGDLVTFLVSTNVGCGDQSKPINKLIDYNMITGHTATILNDGAFIVGYPDNN